MLASASVAQVERRY